jgi:hypothetical protein
VALLSWYKILIRSRLQSIELMVVGSGVAE